MRELDVLPSFIEIELEKKEISTEKEKIENEISMQDYWSKKRQK